MKKEMIELLEELTKISKLLAKQLGKYGGVE